MNLQTEIEELLTRYASAYYAYGESNPGSKTEKEMATKMEEAETQLLQLFDKSVERVIGEDEFGSDDYPTEVERIKDELKHDQRQTWNKIKSGKTNLDE